MTKKMLVAMGIAAAASLSARADQNPELNTSHTHHFAAKGARPGGGGSNNLVYHSGGSVITSARVVSIFWGSQWASGGSLYNTAQHIIGFFGQFGTSSHWTPITQYYQQTGSGTQYIQTTNLGNTSWTDATDPSSANVTDADIQAEVAKYINTQAGGVADQSTIYEVFLEKSLPDGTLVYSSDGSSDSCGGPNLSYCAYHGHITSGSFANVKYSSMPYPSCSGCQSSGFSDAQNFDHFSCHETREAVTDEYGNAWYDRRGYEADDKCAWSPAPFVDSTGYAYQYEWSNSAGGCVK